MTTWLSLLEPLRRELTGRDHRGRVGSLRWLEEVMAERGGRAGAVRNIVYRDAGATEEKLRLFELLAELYEAAGLQPPAPPRGLAAAKAKRALGRDKRRIFSLFLRSLSAGERPRLVAVGGPATGKRLLLEKVEEVLPECYMVSLGREMSPALYTLAEQLGETARFERLVARLSPEQTPERQAALQREVLAVLVEGLNRRGQPLLLRAETEATLSTIPLRGASGCEVSLPVWLTPLLEETDVPYLAALAAAPAKLEYTKLRPPTRKEGRRHLGQLLPAATGERIEALLDRGGRSYRELSRLALVEATRSGDEGEAELMRDPQLGPLLHVLSELSPDVDPAVPAMLLEQVLGKPVSALSPAERAVLAPAGRERDGGLAWRPAVRSLLPPTSYDPDLHAQALWYYRQSGSLFRQLYHAGHVLAWDTLLTMLEQDPSRLAMLPALWSENWARPRPARERLAGVVVRYRSGLGDYAHPEVREALEVLRTSEDEQRNAWARVKLAEARIDAGGYEEGEALLKGLPPLAGEAHVEALLLQAALARWRGAYAEARAQVGRALEVPVSRLVKGRVRFWQGLVAKDAGRFSEAFAGLAKVDHGPLLSGRARYQEGDLLIRLGRPQEGAERIGQALRWFEEASPPHDERARVRARLGASLRHMGRYEEARAEMYGALEAASDRFTHARIASETAVLEAAVGRAWAALRLATHAEVTFRDAGERHEEAAYRRRRTLFRLAVALWVRETGEPYRPPFRGSGRSTCAARILEDVRRQATVRASETDRDGSLLVDCVQLLALGRPAADALAMLEDMPTRDHLGVQVQLSRSEALLRLDDGATAAQALEVLGEVPPAPDVIAWKGTLQAEAQLLLGRERGANDLIDELLSLAGPLCQQVGHVWGRVLVERNRRELAGRWLDEAGPLPLPEALALRFEAGGAASPGTSGQVAEERAGANPFAPAGARGGGTS